MRSQTLRINIEEYGKYTSALLMFFVLCLSGLYIFLINSSVLSTMTRRQNDRNISIISSNVGVLENDYMNLRSRLDIDVAKELGFRDDFSKIHFSSENSSVAGSISLRSDEI